MPPQRKPDPIKRAQIKWSGGAIPISMQFGDVYFSHGDGLAESRHVFLTGNGLPQAWKGQRHFSICELGFGTGLNFLACWDLWRRSRPSGARLNYVSIEGFPLEKGDLARSLRPWPELSRLAGQLYESYPWPHRGYHHLHFNDDVTLTLIMDDVLSALENLEAQIDAWFLDGFAPRCNDDMWAQDAFLEIARLSRPAAALATFTVAGTVRRRLERAGFVVERAAGYGRKRSMLRGRFSGHPALSRGAPWYQTPSPIGKPGRALIIGGGIAGCSVAAALQRRQWHCTLVERQSSLAQGASGNDIGIIMPRLTSDLSPDGRFHAESYRYTIQELTRSSSEKVSVGYDLCGVIQLSADKVDRRRQSALTKAEALPKEMLVALTADEASRVAGAPIWGGSLYFPQGGWLNPASLCTSLVDGVDIRLDTAVSDISFQDGEWHVADSAGTNFAIADIIIVANGAEAYRFSEVAALPLEAFRGQITYLPETKLSANLENVVTFGNYITPSYQGQHIVGATYQPLPIDAASKSQEVRTTDNLRNITALRDHLPELAYGSDSAPKSGRVSVRCTTPDHNPVVGAMPDVHFYEVAYEGIRQGQLRRYPAARYVPGLYVHLGLGSRGLTTALLSAELIASQVAGDPLPLERSLVELVHPGRFFMRALRYDRQLIPAP